MKAILAGVCSVGMLFMGDPRGIVFGLLGIVVSVCLWSLDSSFASVATIEQLDKRRYQRFALWVLVGFMAVILSSIGAEAFGVQ